MPVRLAGRRSELDAVTDVLTGVSNVRALVVAGEAGIGKSRLASAAAEAASQAPRTVLTGWCLNLSETLPLCPSLMPFMGWSSGMRAAW